MMKVKELSGILTKFTSVKIVIDGSTNVFEGFYIDVPSIYLEYYVEHLIPIPHPTWEKRGEAAILVRKG